MKKKHFLIFILNLLMGVTPSTAGLVANGTRIIFGSEINSKTVMLANANEYPVIVQVWVDKAEGVPTVSTPFSIFPAIFKLTEGERKGITILYDGAPLPDNKESLFWLNLYEVPPTVDGRKSPKVTLAMNTQMKLIFRPEKIKKNLKSHLTEVKFSDSKDRVILFNDSPFYVNIATVSDDTKFSDVKFEHKQDKTLAPFGKIEIIKSPSSTGKSVKSLSVEYYNDLGAISKFHSSSR